MHHALVSCIKKSPPLLKKIVVKNNMPMPESHTAPALSRLSAIFSNLHCFWEFFKSNMALYCPVHGQIKGNQKYPSYNKWENREICKMYININ